MVRFCQAIIAMNLLFCMFLNVKALETGAQIEEKQTAKGQDSSQYNDPAKATKSVNKKNNSQTILVVIGLTCLFLSVCVCLGFSWWYFYSVHRQSAKTQGAADDDLESH